MRHGRCFAPVPFVAFWARRCHFWRRPVVVGLPAELGELSAVLVDLLGLFERWGEVDVPELGFRPSLRRGDHDGHLRRVVLDEP